MSLPLGKRINVGKYPKEDLLIPGEILIMNSLPYGRGIPQIDTPPQGDTQHKFSSLGVGGGAQPYYSSLGKDVYPNINTLPWGDTQSW